MTDNLPRTFEIISYDVWGNDKDGYEVNQAFTTGEFVYLREDMTDKEIIEALVNVGYYSPDSLNDMDHVDIEGEFGYSLYIEYKGKPKNELRRLRRVV